MSSTDAVLAEADPFEQPLELRTRIEARQHVVDLVRLDILHIVGSVSILPQPEEVGHVFDVTMTYIYKIFNILVTLKA